MAAATQAEDGMHLEDFVSAYGRAPTDLPPREALEKEVKALGRRLSELRGAGLLERYNGPVLVEGQAAAELFAQAFAPRLAAQRRPVYADARMAQFGGRQTSKLLDSFVSDRYAVAQLLPLVAGYKPFDLIR